MPTDELNTERVRPLAALASLWAAPPTRWLLLAIAALCAGGWYSTLRPVATVWGSVGEWVSGLSALIGLLYVGWQLHTAQVQRVVEIARLKQEEKERRERHLAEVAEAARQESDRRESMARAVGVQGIPKYARYGDRTPASWNLDYAVYNGGEYPIDQVVLVVADPGSEADPASQIGCAFEEVIGTVFPKQTLSSTISDLPFTSEPHVAELSYLVGLIFSDTWGQSWYRSTGVLQRREFPARTC